MRCFFLLILTLITSVFVSAQQRSYTYGDNASAGHYAQASDARIYYEVYGEGDPLIVLHGGQVGSTAEMSQFIDSLRGSYQVIAVSTRGHGKSEIGHSQVTLQQRADDVVAVLSQVTNKPAIVLGFSDGAYTGYSLAASYPER